MTPLSATWRYVDCRDVDAFENNAQVAVVAGSATDDLLAAFRKAVDDAKEAAP
jgi:hypothetical protein